MKTYHITKNYFTLDEIVFSDYNKNVYNSEKASKTYLKNRLKRKTKINQKKY